MEAHPMEFEIRTISSDELEAFRRCQSYAFGNDFNPEHLEIGRPLFEMDRNIAAFDATEMIGTAGIFSFDLTIPGGSIPAAGVTMVSVKPTHRRKGVLTGVMRRQLEMIRDRGESVAILWASESAIYGRFGYGQATQMEITKIPRAYAAIRGDIALPPGRVRALSAEEARATLPPLHERLRVLTPGTVRRTEQWWDIRIFRDIKDYRGGFTENAYVAYEESGVAKGYARYRRKGDFDAWIAKGKVAVEEVYAETPAAYIGLWSHLLGLDLVDEIEYEYGAVDEPLRDMLLDSRRTERRHIDAIWLRIVDVEKALSARRYPIAGKLAFEVRDTFLDGTGGRFELEAGPDGAVCRRTQAAPELVLGAEELGSVYLGGGSLQSLARVGRVTGTPEAIAHADRLFGWHLQPRCQEGF